jgi:NADH-quinone oxidoreductase subunit C
MNPDARLPGIDGIPALRRSAPDPRATGVHADLTLVADDLPAAVRRLNDHRYFLEDIAGVDTAEGIMLVYHFDRFEVASRVALRVIVPHDAPQAPSISSVYPGADWHERECFDFFGVRFTGHPDLKPLLLPEDLGIHPLLKGRGRRSMYSLLPLSRMVDADDQPADPTAAEPAARPAWRCAPAADKERE